MGGKKKAKGKKKGKTGPDIFNDPDEFKSFNVAQRQTIAMLMEKMNALRDENTELRNSDKEMKLNEDLAQKNYVS